MFITSTRGSSSLLLFFLLLLPAFGLKATEAVAGPVVRIENMNKLPGTDRGFPAEDYFTFNRIDRNTNTRGVKLKATSSQQMRIHNDGDRTLVITKLSTTNTKQFRIRGVEVSGSGLKIQPGKYVTVTVEFITNVGRGKRLITEELVMKSNAVNAKDVRATFSGLYMTRPESWWEVDAQQVFGAFGFQTAMGKDKDGKTIVRPSSDYPTASQVNSGKEGDLIVSGWFEQADPKQPVRMLQLAALHGPGGAKTQLLGEGNRVVGGIEFSHGGHWHQSVFPRISNESDQLAYASARRIDEPFKIAIANYKSTGGTGNGSLKDDILGVRVYKAIDQDGRIIPNEYIVLMDYIGTGCGQGSSNCDWNDNIAYLINARPVDRPSAKKLADQRVDPGKKKNISLGGAFNRGYPGNEFTFAATREGGGQLPSWIRLNKKSGALEVDAPRNAGGESFRIKVTATDLNRLKIASSFNLYVGEASEPCVVDANSDGATMVLACDEDDEVRLSGYTSSGKYNWTGPGNFKSSERNPKVRKEGTYTLTGGKDCSETSKVTVTRESDCEEEVNLAPSAVVNASATRGTAPLKVTLDGSKSKDPDGQIVSYLWRWPGSQASGKKKSITLGAGTHRVTLTVTDNEGAKHSKAVTIRVDPAPPPPPSKEEVTYWLEAECATVGAKWSTGGAGGASNGAYVEVKEGYAYAAPPADRPANLLRFTIRSAKKGTYRLFARVMAASPTSDSYYFRVNGGKWKVWSRGMQGPNSFVWREYSEGTVALAAGTNTVDFALRESGTKLDKLYLTSGKTLPKGTGAAAETCTDVVDADQEDIFLEAECGSVGDGWTVERAARASNGRYLVFKGRRSLEAPKNGQRSRLVNYAVTVEEAGEYHLHLRLNAPDYGKNSVWVRVDNGKWIKMWQAVGGGKLETSGFQWREVNDSGRKVVFRLTPGKHTITMANRESGTRIDKMHLSLSGRKPTGEGGAATNCGNAKASLNAKDFTAAADTRPQPSLALFPNPVADELTLNFTEEYTGEVEIMLFDFNGKLVQQSRHDKAGEQLSARLYVGNLPAGMYQVRILTPGKPVIRAFVKQ